LKSRSLIADYAIPTFRCLTTNRDPFVPGHEAVGTIVALGESAKGLKIGQRVGVGWSAFSCLHCHECLTGNHHLCPESQGTIVARYGGFTDRLRVQWLWARPLPDSLDIAKAGPLLCGGVTVFSPLLQHNLPPTARVGVIGIGGLGHMALQFANRLSYEVHAFTTSDSKEKEARKLGAPSPQHKARRHLEGDSR